MFTNFKIIDSKYSCRIFNERPNKWLSHPYMLSSYYYPSCVQRSQSNNNKPNVIPQVQSREGSVYENLITTFVEVKRLFLTDIILCYYQQYI